MVRKLKYHEQKLLKKVDLYHWKNEDNIREIKIIQRFHLQDREDYHKYNKICGSITQLANKLSLLPPDLPLRTQIANQLLQKLYQMGILPLGSNLSECSKIGVSSFCRRRLPVVMMQLKMSETLKEAITFIEQGQVRVGPEIVTDPAYLVTRNLEDFITWSTTSKIRKAIHKYNDTLDDYDLMN